MTVQEDAKKLLAQIDDVGLDITTPALVRLDHMGRLIVDAVLQARQKYTATVLPRVVKFEKRFPEANTTTGFLTIAGSTSLREEIPWRGQARVTRMIEIAELFARHGTGIESLADLRDALEGDKLAKALRQIDGVGRKTVNYIKILAGLDFSAVDSRVKAFAEDAGIEDRRPAHLEAVIREAAALREGATERGIDAAMWGFGQD